MVLFGRLQGSDTESLCGYLRDCGYEVQTAADTRSLLAWIKQDVIDIVVVEKGRGEGRLEKVLAALEARQPGAAVIVVTDHLDDSFARSDVLGRIFDVLEHPIRPQQLLVRVRKAVEMRQLLKAAVTLRGERRTAYAPEGLVAESEAMKTVLQMAHRVAQTDSTVLISGETGTGKELIAGVIHYAGPRSEKPFVRVNCASLPETLLESELFGHERGAFTGAHAERIGRFEQADGGTLLLDEVGDLSGGTQAKLLRVLQEKSFERLGGSTTLSVDVRIIAATNRDLPAEVAAGRFREDLYYRLNVFGIELPPLRERREDIRPLARELLARHAREQHRAEVRLSADAEAVLLNHDWPGNIRELENAIERALIMTDAQTIGGEQLDLARSRSGTEVARAHAPRSWPAALSDGLHDVEKETILSALENSDWIQKDAAKLLRISPRALNYRIRKLGIRHSRWRRNK